MFNKLFLFSLVFFALLGRIQAEPRAYNQISLQTTVSQAVAPDRMQVTLFVERQHSNPAQLAESVTQHLNGAIQQARQFAQITVHQGNRRQTPVYEKDTRKIALWRERAELELSSADFTALAQLTGQLQQQLQIAQWEFSLSDIQRRQYENQLLKKAVAVFSQRARLVTQALNGADYRLVRLDLHQGQHRPPMREHLQLKATSSTPEVAAGSLQLQVSANGVIEVQPAQPAKN